MKLTLIIFSLVAFFTGQVLCGGSSFSPSVEVPASSVAPTTTDSTTITATEPTTTITTSETTTTDSPIVTPTTTEETTSDYGY